MTTAELLDLLRKDNATPLNERIEALSVLPAVANTKKADGTVETPGKEDFRQQFNVSGHQVMDTTRRPDKQILNDDGSLKRLELVNRITIGLQELITERAVSFLFGNPVNHSAPEATDTGLAILKAILRVLKDNKSKSFNQQMALDLFRSKQMAEIWYVVEKDETHGDYGFDTKLKLRCVLVSAWKGDALYPLYDETGDLICFSRQYTQKSGSDGEDRGFFEVYTASETIFFEQHGGEEWKETRRSENPIGKIPVVYAEQPHTEWAVVQSSIDRIEKLLSNHGDTNDYHASPGLFIKGTLTDMPDKGETGKVFMGEENTTMEYVSWDRAPESIKLEIETHLSLIYTMTQTPNLSFDNVKGIGALSGIALKLLFLDAHLKVLKKQRTFDAYLERRINIIKAMLGVAHTPWKKEASALSVESEIQPFMIGDEQAMVELLMLANGNKPVLSQETSVSQSTLTGNAEEEYARIQAEETAAKTFDLGNPTI